MTRSGGPTFLLKFMAVFNVVFGFDAASVDRAAIFLLTEGLPND